MTEFHASVVEVYTEPERMRTIHFDDEGEHYLQLQSPELDAPREQLELAEFEKGYGSVYVEVDTQFYAGFNCFSLAELNRHSFRLVMARDKHMLKIGEVKVTFELADAAFGELRDGLALAFRDFANFHVSETELE